MKKIFVTGGAGYIGSHVVKALGEAGYQVLTYDNLSTGNRWAVLHGDLVVGDLNDRQLLTDTLRNFQPDAVMHFAAFIEVAESVTNPLKYYRNNTLNALQLLEVLRELGIGRYIFSSTAAVYGEPRSVPIPEDHPKAPESPYGRTKLTVEQILDDMRRAHGLESVSLRYFNAAGADPSGEIGERHDPETHLIPLVLAAAADPQRTIRVFGADYPTPDGTCVRDYIHVIDLAQAHILALENLERHPAGKYNLGNGEGYSVLEVVRAAENVTGRAIPVREAPRRPGDAAVLVASSALAKAELGWNPQHGELEGIVRSAWEWHRAHPDGYGA